MRIKKIFIFLLLTFFFCSFDTNHVLAETVGESIKEDVCQTWFAKPEIHLNQDTDNDGCIISLKKEIEISGYVNSCKQNGITEIYFNNEPVPLQEDGSFSKIIEIPIFESKNYEIVIKDAGGNIVDCRTLSVAFSQYCFLLCFSIVLMGLFLINAGVKRNLYYGDREGTKDIVVGIIITIGSVLIIPFMYFSPVL